MKTLFTSIFALLVCYSFGQADLKVQTNEIAQVNDMENLMRSLSYSSNRSEELNVMDVEGSAYLDEEFKEGNVILTTGVSYRGIPLRYNVYNDLIEFRNRNGEVYNINNPEGIKELTIGDAKFVYITTDKYGKIFADVVTEGKVNLLKQYRMTLLPAKPAETHRKAQAPRFENLPPRFLVQYETGTSQSFKNKKELLKLLNSESSKVNELIRTKKLSVHREADLKQIISFYNSFQ